MWREDDYDDENKRVKAARNDNDKTGRLINNPAVEPEGDSKAERVDDKMLSNS
jgi:hypothetical protein